tara:strand:- start:1696 stop:2532 length:837 start_codon:yes stop_codon:yes gene_type:complete
MGLPEVMITVLGSSGFIGSQIVKDLRIKNIDYFAPKRDAIIQNQNLGDIIYCIGLTADFRTRPHDTITAHVSYLNDLIQNNNFNSLTYLSSTRVYIHNKNTDERSDIIVSTSDPFDFYNSTKITGELLALNSGKKNIKIARLSNVFGMDFESNNFITSITKDALTSDLITLRTTAKSSKDYISVLDVSEMLIQLAQLNKSGIYNVSKGKNTENRIILNRLKELTGCVIKYDDDAVDIIFPVIVNTKIVNELNYSPKYELVDELEIYANEFKIRLKNDT